MTRATARAKGTPAGVWPPVAAHEPTVDAIGSGVGELLHLDFENVFDADSLCWYRRMFEDQSTAPCQVLTDMEFLHEWGS